jgi:hypothetical protein
MHVIPALRAGRAPASKAEMAHAHKCRFQCSPGILQEWYLLWGWRVNGIANRACDRRMRFYYQPRLMKRWLFRNMIVLLNVRFNHTGSGKEKTTLHALMERVKQ